MIKAGIFSFVFIFILAGLTGCGEKMSALQSYQAPGQQASTAPIQADDVHDLKLACETVRLQKLANNLMVTGQIHPQFGKEVDVTARVAGRVTATFVQPGQHVKPGHPLAQIDSQEIGDLQAELLEAKSKLQLANAHEERERGIYENLLRGPKELVEARTNVEQAKVELELAEADHKRQLDLYKEKIASAKDFLAAQAKFRKAESEYKQAKSHLEREEGLFKNKNLLKRDFLLAHAETQRASQHLKTIKQRLQVLGMTELAIEELLQTDNMHASVTIVAPASGIITHQDVYSGELIDPGKRAFVITDLSSVAVSADIPEVDLASVKKGMKVDVKVSAFPEERFTGTINYLSARVNPETRTVQIRAQLDNSDLRLKSNMFAEIRIETPPTLALACPRSAIHLRDGHSVVYVIDKNGYGERPIKVGRTSEQYTEVVSGLNEGEKIVTDGSLLLKTELTANH
jgi:membrane fusion protein, heavy metal efflux system